MMNDTRTVSKKERNSMEEKELTSTAYHEAGHAFAYWLTGKEFDRATISPDGKGLGELATNYKQKRGWINLNVVNLPVRERFLVEKCLSDLLDDWPFQPH